MDKRRSGGSPPSRLEAEPDGRAKGRSITRVVIPIGLFVATLAVHTGLAWSLSGSDQHFRPLKPDAHEYQHLARNLLQYGRYGFGPNWRDDRFLAKSKFRLMYDDDGVSMYRAPGHPALLAAMKWAGIGERPGEQFVFAGMNGVTGVVVYTLARRLFGALAGVCAGVLFVLNPGVIYALTKGGREPVLALLFTVGFLLAVIALRRQTVGVGLVSGLCFGVAGYFKVSAVAAGSVVGLVLVGIALYRRRVALVRAAAVLLIFVALPLLPWIARNSLAIGAARLEPELTGVHLRNLIVDEEWRTSPRVLAVLDPSKAKHPLEADRIFKEQLRTYIREHPMASAAAWAASAGFFWSPVGARTGRTAPFGLFDAVALLYWVPCLALVATSFWIYRARQETWLIVAVVLSMTALNTGQARHRIPFEPMLIVSASGALTALYAWWIAWKRSAVYTERPAVPDLR